MDVDGLARSVVEQVVPGVPDGVQVSVVEDAGIHVAAGLFESTFGFGSIAGQPGDRPRTDYVETAVRVFLDHLQDVIVRHTTEPWPSPDFPLPQGAVRGNRVDAWYGTDGAAGPRVSVEVLS